MIKYIILAAILGMALARPQQKAQRPEEVIITRSENENNGDGTFKWNFEQSDGTKVEQSGYVKPGPDPENSIQVIQGRYSYYDLLNQLFELSYIADENGFQPSAAYLPTPPPIPPAIQKSLDIIQALNVKKA